MEFFDNRMICKSTPGNFEKEKSNKKNNTVREFGKTELKEILTIQDNINHYGVGGKAQKIVIMNSDTGEFFERDITDITMFKSWEEEKSKPGLKKGQIEQWTEDYFIYIISFC